LLGVGVVGVERRTGGHHGLLRENERARLLDFLFELKRDNRERLT
jgi:hypothetical protein